MIQYITKIKHAVKLVRLTAAVWLPRQLNGNNLKKKKPYSFLSFFALSDRLCILAFLKKTKENREIRNVTLSLVIGARFKLTRQDILSKKQFQKKRKSMIAEPARGAPLLSKLGNLSIQVILVVTSSYARTCARPCRL